MNSKKLLRELAKFYPKSLKESYDRVGKMINNLKDDTATIVLCLDFDEIVYQQIADKLDNIDLIISHHPFFFGPKGRIMKNDPLKKELYEKMVVSQVPLYAFHTNFDAGKAHKGMNDAIIEELGFKVDKIAFKDLAMRGCHLNEKMAIDDFALLFKKTFALPMVELINAGQKEITSFALIAGGGSRRYLEAMNSGYDLFISGDAPHHVRREIVLNKYNYLNVYHEIERIFLKRMKKTLLEIDPSLNIILIDHEEFPKII